MTDSNGVSTSSNLLKSIVRDTCSYYGKPPVLVDCEENGKIPVVQLHKNEKCLRGMRNIIDGLNIKHIGGLPEKCAIADWADYCIIKILYKTDDLNLSFKELDTILRDRVHLVGFSTTAADVLVYYYMYNIMVSLSLKDKEKYSNLSRWFDYIQQDEKLRGQRPILSFSRTKLFT